MWALLERICSPKSQGLQDQTPPPQKWETWCQRHQDFAEELSDLGWGAPLFLFGVLADPKHPEIHLPPPKKCLSLAPCSSLPFLPHSLSHQWTTVFWHCLWEAQNKCHTCLAMTPTARSGWLSIYNEDKFAYILRICCLQLTLVGCSYFDTSKLGRCFSITEIYSSTNLVLVF